MKKGPKITLDTKSGGIKIYIQGALHLYIARADELIGFQSWVMGRDYFCIEYYTKDKAILCSYNDEGKWRTILSLLDNL